MIPVIISGGSGTRLWPVSRQSIPKQFSELFEKSLFDQTLERVKPLGSPWVITTRSLNVLTARSLQAQEVPTSQAIYEPFGRNTAPAIALVCKIFEDKGLSEEIVGVFPADHLISDDKSFQEAARTAARIAATDQIVTLGVRPTFPATGYGYIETTANHPAGEAKAVEALRFREKPNEATAREFLAKGNYFWNAGMFIFKVAHMIDLFHQHAPEIWKTVSEISTDFSNIDEKYQKVQNLSIDYAIMEKLGGHICIPCEFEWNDVGSWDALASVLGKESSAPAARTAAVASDGCFVHPLKEKTYAMVGVSDLIVVDTPDALLVAKKGVSERVKEIVDHLQSRREPCATQHQHEIRPWGTFEILRDETHFKSKTITVDAGQQLSYQSHTKRAEHWIIVRGSGEVVLDEKVIPVRTGSHVFIPIGAKHRMRNTGTEPLQFVEVQLGTYFGEDDITRYQDDYKRV